MMFVGEAWGEEEEQRGQPFVGSSGRFLRSICSMIGINLAECYLTNVFNLHPPSNNLRAFAGTKAEAIPGLPQLGQQLWIHNRYKPELDRLWSEIDTIKPNVIVALGATAMWALCRQTGIKKYRGTTLPASNGTKVFACYHPSAVLRQYKLRPIFIADLEKAKREAASPTLVRPKRLIYMEPSLDDIARFYSDHIAPVEAISADIETKQNTITEIGIAPSPDRAIVIPFYNHDTGGSYWSTAAEEVQAWLWVQRILREKPVIGQNISYDLQYCWRANHIAMPVIADDTMILHHAMYPEMEKSLGFLGSIYTDEPSWKFMRADNETLKQEDE